MIRKQWTSHPVITSSRKPNVRKLHVEPLEDRRMLAVFTVTNLNDSGDGSLPQPSGRRTPPRGLIKLISTLALAREPSPLLRASWRSPKRLPSTVRRF